MQDYDQILRPDALLLQHYPAPSQFENSKFWSPAALQGNIIPDGFKMKWHQLGPGRVQLRLPVGLLKDAYLCEAYVKTDPKAEKRFLAWFKTHLELIRRQKYTESGRLT